MRLARARARAAEPRPRGTRRHRLRRGRQGGERPGGARRAKHVRCGAEHAAACATRLILVLGPTLAGEAVTSERAEQSERTEPRALTIGESWPASEAPRGGAHWLELEPRLVDWVAPPSDASACSGMI